MLQGSYSPFLTSVFPICALQIGTLNFVLSCTLFQGFFRGIAFFFGYRVHPRTLQALFRTVFFGRSSPFPALEVGPGSFFCLDLRVG